MMSNIKEESAVCNFVAITFWGGIKIRGSKSSNFWNVVVLRGIVKGVFGVENVPGVSFGDGSMICFRILTYNLKIDCLKWGLSSDLLEF